jgi:Tfp pilus assembly protein PilF
MSQGDEAQAEEAFRSALAGDPEFSAPYSALIRLELGRQEWGKVAMLAGNLLLLTPATIRRGSPSRSRTSIWGSWMRR